MSLQRRTPMKRTGFKSPGWTPRPVKTIEYTPRPRATVVAVVQPRTLAAPVPKFAYVRDTRFRSMCRALACQHCGAAGPDAGVTWAHSNQSRHGKGGAIKASDQYVAAMCARCHRELDQGKDWDEATKVAIWTAAHRKTVLAALAQGLWPSGVPIPDTTEPCKEIEVCPLSANPQLLPSA